MRSNPSYTLEDVKAVIRAWDAERGKTSNTVHNRAYELVRIVRGLKSERAKRVREAKPRPPKAKVVRQPKPRPPKAKPDPMDAAQHYGLVHMVIRRYKGLIRGRIELEDLVQEGLLGVMRAQQSWDPAKGTFATHAYYWIRHRVLRYIQEKQRCVRVPTYLLERGNAPRERVVHLDAPCGGEGSPRHERVGKRDAAFEHGLTRLELKRLLTLIPDERQRSVISAHYVGGLTLAQVGGALGICLERARQLEHEGLDHIRRHLRRHAPGCMQNTTTPGLSHDSQVIHRLAWQSGKSQCTYESGG
jgi:RNA polymerase sigma factor (sigma-70 family)